MGVLNKQALLAFARDETVRAAYAFGIGPAARHTDPPTSHQAAALAALRAGSQRTRVLRALAWADQDGLTDFELADAIGSRQTSCGVRRSELVKLGLVMDSERHRKAPSGANAIVWICTPHGAETARRLA